MEEAMKKASATFQGMLDKAMSKLDQALEKFLVDEECRTAKELTQMTTVVNALNDMNRLEQDKPTSIVGNMPLTRHNLKEKFQKLKELGIPIGVDLEGILAEPPSSIDPEKFN